MSLNYNLDLGDFSQALLQKFHLQMHFLKSSETFYADCIGFISSATRNFATVFSRTSSTETPSATSVNTSSPISLSTSNTAISVMIMSTIPFPVRGSEHLSRIFGAPFFEQWSIVTTTRLPQLTRSIAPPIPFTIFPGITQFAKSPFSATSSAPSTVTSMCEPRIIAKLSPEENIEDPGRVVTVSLPALIRSGCSSPGSGYGPMPRSPFSL
mmetsp:Transcript_22955/g.55691  ORF Transcript_22955/g.55691 Transcript_22955/m.55691 type:complete len:211 (+) Transcript_22955:99-731(+)